MPRLRKAVEPVPFNNACCSKSWFPWEGSYVCVHCGQASVTLTHVTRELAQAS